ncbi:phosphatidylglycerophosphatase A [Parvibaculum sp.]|uniref:phosphatidylglycerophosphatase A family protein n=1 Tax=Parvibaculum sp. TaxID=2024848 RepID=UPI001DBEBBB5|nr:phosphatidylglycerophosphatase A [Parvibaculum sp.]MBX3487831.1 phosphatidylglycerophosphatase A [Parvibaculum sp.]MCW5728177.1 phosphatidylglycerophosphatase A [Parvibaculum sp.]
MSRFTPLPAGLRFGHPVVLVATWFGAGLIRPAPGTWGSLAAMPFAFVIVYLLGAPALALAAFAAFAAGIWAAERYCAASGTEDASEVVIDEVAAVWLVLAALPMSPVNWLAGFALFRLFDIWKPWPIGAVERRFKGGFGVMADDVVAAIYAVIAFILCDILIGIVI